MRVTVRLRVSGRVQGVSFRASLQEKATRNKVDGWVRNTVDGSVEALLQGDEEAVMKVVEWARVGPPRAVVTSLVHSKIESHPGQRGFRVVQ